MADAQEPPPGVALVRARNQSPLTLEGTNTWIVEGWVVDPGPDDAGHLERVREAAGRIVGIVLTHSHADHSGGAEALAHEAGVAVGRPAGGERMGPFEAIATPGHSPDSVCLLAGRVLFTGDTVLGEGSVFIAPGDGSLAAYLDSLERLLALDVAWICPGHGPVVAQPHARLREYRAHRLERERAVLAALEAGARTAAELVERAWTDVDFAAAPLLRPAAEATLAAHLEKLRGEGRLPGDLDPAALAGPAWAREA